MTFDSPWKNTDEKKRRNRKVIVKLFMLQANGKRRRLY